MNSKDLDLTSDGSNVTTSKTRGGISIIQDIELNNRKKDIRRINKKIELYMREYDSSIYNTERQYLDRIISFLQNKLSMLESE